MIALLEQGGTALRLQIVVLALIFAWLLAVAIRFRRSTLVLTGGLVVVGALVLAGVMHGDLTLARLGLVPPRSIAWTFGFALAGLAVMLAYSPVADRIATRFFAKPPTLRAFRALQQSMLRLVIGIAIAWALGGFLEELTFRGLVLRSVEAIASGWLPALAASALAVLVAASGAGVIHLYQGPRAVLIITQLSVLFGVLYVVSGHDLLAVMLCHGLYDTIAFIRFARGTSRYAKSEAKRAAAEQEQRPQAR